MGGGAYLALARAGFRRQASHRGTLLAGLAANLFFGVFRSEIFQSLHGQRDVAAGLGLAETMTYVWVVQVVFGVVFAPWIWEWPESVRAGDFLGDLLRPGDVLLRLAAVDLGRTAFALLFRGIPLLLLPALVLELALPASVLGWLALAASLAMTCLAAFHYRFLFGASAFWTADFRGWWALCFGAVWLGAGLVVPVEMFPQPLRWLALNGPLASLFAIPFRVAIGHDVLASLALQAAWVVAGFGACRLVMSRAERTLVVHGG